MRLRSQDIEPLQLVLTGGPTMAFWSSLFCGPFSHATSDPGQYYWYAGFLDPKPDSAAHHHFP